MCVYSQLIVAKETDEFDTYYNTISSHQSTFKNSKKKIILKTKDIQNTQS